MAATNPTLAEAIEITEHFIRNEGKACRKQIDEAWAVVKEAAEKQLPLTKIVNRIISPISFDADDYGYEGIPQSPKENP